MKFIGKVGTTLVVLFASAGVCQAQSMAEISAAKSMAKAYGYSDKEIENVLNHNIGGTAVTTPAVTAPMTTVAPTTRTEAPVQEETAPVTILTPSAPAETEAPGAIYGHSYFKSKGLSVVPTYNAPAPASYVLGPGDELVIDIWGASTSHIVAEIGNDGAISVFDMGPVYLSGMTLKNAESTLKDELSRLYSGLDSGKGGDTFLKLSIGKIKGVVVSILGEVATPGAYTIPSLSSITSAIFLAGGVTDNGTVRNINLFRAGKKVSSFDLYAFIFDGKFDPNIRLQEGDIISVEPYSSVVSVRGYVNRVQRYEVKPGECIADVIRYAGGFTTTAQRNQVNLTRRNDANGESYDIDSESFKTFVLKDGDVVSVRNTPEFYNNRVSISGPVANPGRYAITDGIRDVASLIRAAGGLLEGAYLGRGQINRLDENRLPVFFSFDLKKVMAGEETVLLNRDDRVTLFTQDELREKFSASVTGFVNTPGTFDFSEGMTVADAIILAKGVKEDALLTRGQINRTDHQGVPRIIPFNVANVLSGKDNILLTRNDEIRIYSIRELRQDATIEITGEVQNPLTVTYREGMTLEDLVMLAGGFTNGVDLTNFEVASRGGRERGTVATYNLETNPELYKMTFKPYDVVSFRRLTYFRPQTTVTVGGEVVSPGTYVVDKAEVRLSDVLGKVGGFTQEAYVHGTSLKRNLTEKEIEMQRTAVMIANQSLGKDTLKLEELQTSYTVAIELDKALKHPGSSYDVILRPGDVISVPAMNNTVRVRGAVFYPNVLSYVAGDGWKQYVNRAGGFANRAKRNKSYIVYMNGNVSAVGRGMAVEPGAEIIVPQKEENENKKLNIGELAAITSSTTSLASLIATITGLFLR